MRLVGVDLGTGHTVFPWRPKKQIVERRVMSVVTVLGFVDDCRTLARGRRAHLQLKSATGLVRASQWKRGGARWTPPQYARQH